MYLKHASPVRDANHCHVLNSAQQQTGQISLSPHRRKHFRSRYYTLPVLFQYGTNLLLERSRCPQTPWYSNRTAWRIQHGMNKSTAGTLLTGNITKVFFPRLNILPNYTCKEKFSSFTPEILKKASIIKDDFLNCRQCSKMNINPDLKHSK